MVTIRDFICASMLICSSSLFSMGLSPEEVAELKHKKPTQMELVKDHGISFVRPAALTYVGTALGCYIAKIPSVKSRLQASWGIDESPKVIGVLIGAIGEFYYFGARDNNIKTRILGALTGAVLGSKKGN